MRRLTNVEYNNSVRDLTGVDLQPAREFPADAAAGEGFTNVGDALVMSPSMLDKYLAAAKGIAAHAVLLPDGFRFSEKTTRPDWSEEILTEIKRLYRAYTDPRGSTRVNLQGLQWDTNSGGRIPLEKYLAATIEHRDAPPDGQEVARGDRGRGPPEPEVPADPLGPALDPGSPARHRSGPRAMAEGQAGGCPAARRRDPPVASRTHAVQERRPLQALAGGRQPARGVAGVPRQAEPRAGRRGRRHLARHPGRRRRQRT